MDKTTRTDTSWCDRIEQGERYMSDKERIGRHPREVLWDNLPEIHRMSLDDCIMTDYDRYQGDYRIVS